MGNVNQQGELSDDEFHQLSKNAPLLSIDIIPINIKGEILLGLRKNKPAEDYWFVPGGRIGKAGQKENRKEAFTRIIRQELGEELSKKYADGSLQLSFTGVYEHQYEDGDNKWDDNSFGVHYLVSAYKANVDQIPKDIPTDQHAKYKWFSIKELLDDERVHPFTKQYFVSFSATEKADLLNLYSIYQEAISYYTNVIWQFPTALVALIAAAFVYILINKLFLLALVLLLVDIPFIHAYCKLVENERKIINCIRGVENQLREKVDTNPAYQIIPTWDYGKILKIRSGDFLKYALLIAEITLLIWVLYSLLY